MILTLEKPTYGGDCIAHLPNKGGKPGKAVFVPLTLPGEIVEAQITADKRNQIQAEATGLLAASPNRIAPACTHYGQCGGCHYQHADYSTQLALKQQILRETLERNRVPFPSEIQLLAADPWHYRNRIRLAFTPEGGIGYRSRRSHDVVPIVECPIAAPLLIRAGLSVARFLHSYPLAFPIPEIELFTDPAESQLLLTLYFNPPTTGIQTPEILKELQSALARELPVPKTGIWLRLLDNSIEAQFAVAMPPHTLFYPAAGFTYQVEHGAFFQVNRWLVDDFVALVTSGYSGNTAWDLYCGVGLFARQLTASFAQVVAVEWSPNSQHELNENLAGSAATTVRSTTLKFLQQNRENREPRPDLIILDPPRAGLGDQVTTLLNAVGAPRMVYVSCDPTTLARDLRALTEERYQIESLTLVDMFPQTFHMETVVVLRRF